MMEAKIMETAQVKVDNENSMIEKVELKEFHSRKYLENLKATKYKNKKVVFILPNGKEYK